MESGISNARLKNGMQAVAGAREDGVRTGNNRILSGSFRRLPEILA
jgi:hypothetical protein